MAKEQGLCRKLGKVNIKFTLNKGDYWFNNSTIVFVG